LTDLARTVRVAARALARAGLVHAYGHCSARIDAERFLVCPATPMGLIPPGAECIEVAVKGPLPAGVLGEVRLPGGGVGQADQMVGNQLAAVTDAEIMNGRVIQTAAEQLPIHARPLTVASISAGTYAWTWRAMLPRHINAVWRRRLAQNWIPGASPTGS